MVCLALLACAIRASAEAKYTAVQCYPGVTDGGSSASYSESGRAGREAFCYGDGLGIYLPSRGAEGRYGQWTISAPEGTHFSYVSLSNRRGARQGWRPRTVAIGTDDSLSYIKGWRDGDWHSGWTLGNFKAVAAKLVCRPDTTATFVSRGTGRRLCEPSWAAYVFARQFKFVIRDTTAPVISDVQGSLFSSGTKSGIQTGTFSVSDKGGGVQQVFLRVNGTRAATRNYACHLANLEGTPVADQFTPCPGSRTEILAVNTSAAPFRAGSNSVQVCASDYTDSAASGFPANVACSAERIVNVGSGSGTTPGGNPPPPSPPPHSPPPPSPHPPSPPPPSPSPPPPSPPPPSPHPPSPSPPPPSGSCPLSQLGAPLQMSMPGCTLIASDTASNPDPRNFWGNIECGRTWGNSDPSRAQRLFGSGDAHVTATGAAQGNAYYRRLTVLDGDDYSGERCELGRNNHDGPTAFYREGERRATLISLRLPSNFPLGVNTWQTVMQLKQAQPADNGGGVPILFMGAYQNQWHIESVNAQNQYWQFPARPGVWTRFAWDVFYSDDPNKGWLQVSADLNNDGDFNDTGERTPVIHNSTLKTESAGPAGGSDGLNPGDPIPDHLRTGVYHDPSIPCPAPTGCSIEVDNVQVLKSPSAP
jgi:Polysaccharide lyase